MTPDIRYGIAAQIALFEFLRDRLATTGTGRMLSMTEPGSAKGRLQGIDFYLVSPEGELDRGYPYPRSGPVKPAAYPAVPWFVGRPDRAAPQCPRHEENLGKI